MTDPLRRTAGLSVLALLAGSGTLVCCVLPATMVALGAGAVLAAWVSAVPQLIWLSEHKIAVFASAGIALAAAGWSLWRSRRLPCPADPAQARACRRLRRTSTLLFTLASMALALGATFAFVLPLL